MATSALHCYPTGLTRSRSTRRPSEELLGAAIAGVGRLNDRYGPAADGPRLFFLLHRRRLWNEGEGKWIGWERKRGKLHEFNRLLRGATDTTFLSIGGEPPRVPAKCSLRHYLRYRYAASHRRSQAPDRENGAPTQSAKARPRFSPRGWGLWRAAAARDAITSHRARWLDVSARVLESDRHRPLRSRRIGCPIRICSRRGSYSGKGIYEVDAFEAALTHRIAENTVLSHDLVGGNLCTCRPRIRRGSVRGFSDALRRRRIAPASMGAWGLAVATVDRWPQ